MKVQLSLNKGLGRKNPCSLSFALARSQAERALGLRLQHLLFSRGAFSSEGRAREIVVRLEKKGAFQPLSLIWPAQQLWLGRPFGVSSLRDWSMLSRCGERDGMGLALPRCVPAGK